MTIFHPPHPHPLSPKLSLSVANRVLCFLEKQCNWPWSLWLSLLGVVLQTKRLLVRFPIRARAWVVGSVPSWGRCKRQPVNDSLTHQCFSPSLSPSPSHSLESIKRNKIKRSRVTGRAQWFRAVPVSYLASPVFLFCKMGLTMVVVSTE